MTNREKLLEELAALDNAAFYIALTDHRCCVAMENAQCTDCVGRFGPCPCPDADGPCRVSTEEWMDWPCRRERLLPEARA